MTNFVQNLRLGMVLLTVAACICGVWLSGWFFRDNRARAELLAKDLDVTRKLKNQTEECSLKVASLSGELSTLRDAIQRDRETAQAIADQKIADLLDAERKAMQREFNRKKELDDAKKRADDAGRSRCNLSNEWVHLYDQALDGSADSEPAAQGAASAPAGAGTAAQEGSGLDEWDVNAVHSENARRWESCRAQLNAVIDWSQKLEAAGKAVYE